MKSIEQKILDIVCPGNEIIYGMGGRPSVMVKIPRMTYAQLGMGESEKVHPAFVINGKEADAIYISKYENIIENGCAYSVPLADPSVGMDFDEARAACEANGRGWHLMTKIEWAMLAQWCKNNGTLPLGNCHYGKDLKENSYHAFAATESEGRTNRVLTGSGPQEWSHNFRQNGIWDLKGNLGEWTGGVRTVFGELQILSDNDGADQMNSQSRDSACWKAVDGVTGELCSPDGKGTTENTLKLEFDGSVWKWTTQKQITHTDRFYGCPFADIVCAETVGTQARALLQAYGFLITDSEKEFEVEDYFYANSGAEERFFGCGGHFKHGREAGIFCSHGTTGRKDTSVTRGFRSAYVKLLD